MTVIKDIARFNPENIGRNFQFEIIEYVDTSSVDNGKLVDTQVLELKRAPSRAKRLIQNNDILISTVRPNLKHFYFVKNCKDNTVVSTGFVVIRPHKVVPRFLYYFLTTEIYTEFLSAVADSHTSTYPSFPPEIIENSEIVLPSEDVQKFIAKILGNIDDHVVLLEKQNHILEKIIQSIFKSWFIDFDGQTEFVDSELGQIPKGWKIGTLGDIAENIRDLINPKKISSNVNYIGLEHMPREKIFLDNWNDSSETITSNKFRFKKGDILFGKLRPYFRKVGISPIQGICSTDILIINPKEPTWLGFVLCIVSSKNFINFTDSSSHGTRMPRTDWDTMKNFQIIIPPIELIKKYNYVFASILNKVMINVSLIHNLMKIRDSLLPKLMSGEIQV